MATLTGQTIASTYDGLLKLSDNDGLTASVKNIQDGLGVSSPVNISTAVLFIKPTSDTSSTPTSGKEFEVVGNALITGDLQVDNINIDGNTISATSGVVTLASGAIATTQSQNDNSTKIATTAYVDSAVDGVDTLAEILAIGNTTGSTKISVNNSSSGIDLVDDALLRLGTGNDLVIRHDASNSHIENATGTLNIEANNLRLGSYGTDNYIIATNAGSVELYHNDVKKFETTSLGVTITGDLLINTTGGYFEVDVSDNSIKHADNTKAKFGTGNDLEIFHDSSHSYIDDVGVGNLRLRGNAGVQIMKSASSEIMGEFIADGAVNLYHDNSKKFETTSAGVSVTGDGLISGDLGIGSTGIFASSVSLNIDGTGLAIKNNVSGSSNNWSIIKNSATGSSANLEFVTGGGTSLTLNHDMSATFAGDVKLAGNGTDNDSFAINFTNGACAIARDNNDLELHAYDNMIFGVSNTSYPTSTERMRITSAGLVGINETSPDASLHIKSSDNLLAILESTDSLAYMSFVDSSTTSNTSVAIGADANNLAFYTGTSFGTEKMRLTSSGLLGLGTTSPNRVLEASSNASDVPQIRASYNSTNYLDIKHNTLNAVSSGGNDSIEIQTGGTTGLTIDVSQNATFAGNVDLADSKKVQLGASQDLKLYHDGSHSYIQDSGTGVLKILSSGVTFQNEAGSLNTLVLDSSGNATFAGNVSLADSKKILLGNSSDLEIFHDGNSVIRNQTGDLFIDNYADDGDIKFRSDDGSGSVTEYFRLDGGATKMVASKDLHFADSVKAMFGNISGTSDLKIYHDGSNSYIQDSGTGNLLISGTQVDIMNPDASEYKARFLTDGAAELYHDNSKKLETTSTGVTISSTGAGAIATVEAGDANQASLDLKNTEGHYRLITDGGELKVFDQTDSRTPFLIDTSGNATFAGTVSLLDTKQLILGSATDFDMVHDGTETFISNSTGNLTIVNNTDDGDIIFKSDDGSGGTTPYFQLDGSSTRVDFLKNISIADDVQLNIGDSDDLRLQHTSGNSFIQNATGNLRIIQSADDGDITFESDDGSGGTTEYFKLDGNNVNVRVSQNFSFNDSVKASFGNSGDLQITHNGTNTEFNNYNGGVNFVQHQADGDIIFYADNGSGSATEYLRLDGGLVGTLFSKRVMLPDSIELQLGTAGDLQIYHDSANSYVEQQGTGDLIIRNSTDDKDILLQTDNGSGLVTSYIQLDGSDLSTKILTQKVILSNLPTSDPNNAGQLYVESGFMRVSAG